MTKEEIRFRVKTSVQAREQILTVDDLGDWDVTGSSIRIETTKVMSTWYVTAIYSTKRPNKHQHQALIVQKLILILKTIKKNGKRIHQHERYIQDITNNTRRKGI